MIPLKSAVKSESPRVHLKEPDKINHGRPVHEGREFEKLDLVVGNGYPNGLGVSQVSEQDVQLLRGNLFKCELLNSFTE